MTVDEAVAQAAKRVNGQLAFLKAAMARLPRRKPAWRAPVVTERHTSPMVEGPCMCGAKPGETCRDPDQTCTSLNHPVIRARVEAEYGG